MADTDVLLPAHHWTGATTSPGTTPETDHRPLHTLGRAKLPLNKSLRRKKNLSVSLQTKQQLTERFKPAL